MAASGDRPAVQGGGIPILGGGAAGGQGAAGQKGGSAKPGQEEPKKLFVKSDENWKEAAQREKDKLQEETAAREDERRGALPAPSFAAFVGDLGMQALLALGLIEIEGGGRPPPDLPAARYTIDLIGVLQEKTKGNLSPEEKHHLDEILHSLRVQYARVAQWEAAALAKRANEAPKKPGP